MSSPSRPALTFPPEIRKTVREYYQNSSCILEYGSGGSTVLASELPNKVIFSVESDFKWTQNLESFIASSPLTQSHPRLLHANIGETRAWGHPANTNSWRSFSNYPLLPWKSMAPHSPDIILIDGRFRSACFIACAFSIRKVTTILFDDFVERRYKEITAAISEPSALIGRMAIFELEPGEYSNSQFMEAVPAFFDPS